jgi:hypothetical protein
MRFEFSHELLVFDDPQRRGNGAFDTHFLGTTGPKFG